MSKPFFPTTYFNKQQTSECTNETNKKIMCCFLFPPTALVLAVKCCNINTSTVGLVMGPYIMSLY